MWHIRYVAGKIGGGIARTVVEKDDGKDELRKVSTLIRHYLHIEPDSLSDEQWVMRWNEVKWLMEWQDKKFKAMMGG